MNANEMLDVAFSPDTENALKSRSGKGKRGMAIEDKLIDQMLANYRKPEDLIGPEGLVIELKKRLINRVLEPSSRSRFQRWSADEVGFSS